MSLATSYAQALYESAKEAGGTSASIAKIESEMDTFQAALEGSSDLRKALFGPIVSTKEKLAVIDSIASKGSFSQILKNFLALLANKERLSAFGDIRDAFTSVRLEAEGGVSGRVVSADPLSEKDVKGLADAFSRKFGKRVEFRVSTDASLLAGMKVIVNGVTYDGSLKSQLQQLRDAVVSAHSAH